MTISKKQSFYNLKCLVLLILILLSNACKKDEEEIEEYVGNWIECSDFEGVARSDAVAFTIGNKGYVGSGYDGYDRLSDFWEFDIDRNTWVKIADFPGDPRNGAVAFAIKSKGYVGLGYDGINKLNDFWQYDPDSNKWSQISDFGGTARYGAIAFTIGDSGYVGAGYDGNHLKDIWLYNPVTDQWKQKVSIGGNKRRDAVAFVINEKAYVCSGLDNGVYEDDFWVYDPIEDSWSEKNSISDATDESFDDEYTSLTGINKVAFSLDGKGYLATGGAGRASSIVWEYDPATDLWTQKTSLEGSDRLDAVAFVAGSRAYVTTGRNSGYYFDDIWEFKPNEEYDEYD